MANKVVGENAGGVRDPSVYDRHNGLHGAARYPFTGCNQSIVGVGTAMNNGARCISTDVNLVFFPTIGIKILMMNSDGHIYIHRTLRIVPAPYIVVWPYIPLHFWTLISQPPSRCRHPKTSNMSPYSNASFDAASRQHILYVW